MDEHGYVEHQNLNLAHVVILITKILHIANVFSIAFNIGCAFAPSSGSLIAFRFLGACFSG